MIFVELSGTLETGNNSYSAKKYLWIWNYNMVFYYRNVFY